jgi:high-affinity nickel-transport protein
MLSLLFLGLLLGVRHAADPDHVVAVGAIVSRQRSLLRATSIGALWGAGHTATILVVGGAIVTFQLAVPPRLGLALEFAVGVMLVALGIGNLLRKPAPGAPPRGAFRALGVGVVHGLAGSAAVALLVLATIKDPRWAVAYLAVFGAGTIVGMIAMTTAIALPSLYATRRVPALGGALRVASGALSVGIGIFVMHQIGVTNGLFSAAPLWTPR